jgi:geranylgeranyl reductase family protein
LDDFDLIIVGAGPAGTSTALHLLQMDAGWAGRMLLLEKAAHPRPKLCGGGVTRLGLGILRDLGLPFPLPLPQARVDDVRLQYRAHTIHARGSPQFVVFHRPELDAYLAEQARQRGAQIRENEAVTSFSIDREGVTVTTSHSTYRARALVAADGSKGIVRQTLERKAAPRPHAHVARLLETVSNARQDSPLMTQRYARVDFTSTHDGLQGYCWDFPAWVGGQTASNRGIYDARVAVSRPRAHLPALLQEFLASTHGNDTAPVEGHPIHWFSPRNRLAWARLLLVGDAAGADPLFGEGIAPALGYGQVAAQTLQAAFDTGDFSFQDYRKRVLSSKVGHYLYLRWAVAEGAYRLSEQEWFMRLAWVVGDGVARLWPELEDLYSSR